MVKIRMLKDLKLQCKYSRMGLLLQEAHSLFGSFYNPFLIV
jgi:hypothetical protein